VKISQQAKFTTLLLREHYRGTTKADAVSQVEVCVTIEAGEQGAGEKDSLISPAIRVITGDVAFIKDEERDRYIYCKHYWWQ
jgi:hypothetical protein